MSRLETKWEFDHERWVFEIRANVKYLSKALNKRVPIVYALSNPIRNKKTGLMERHEPSVRILLQISTALKINPAIFFKATDSGHTRAYSSEEQPKL